MGNGYECHCHDKGCEDCKPDKTSGSEVALNDLLCWLAIIQRDHKTITYLKFFDDGSGAIMHQPYDEEEFIKYWDNLEELLKLMEPI